MIEIKRETEKKAVTIENLSHRCVIIDIKNN